MSSVIEEIRLSNFMGYWGPKPQKALFSPGLNLIRGRNSVGKSTLLEALVYGLYGDVPGVTPSMLVSRASRASRSMEVYVRFRSPVTGNVVEILRSGRLEGNSFRTTKIALRVNGKSAPVSGKEEARAKVIEELGLSQRRFMDLVYIEQGKLESILAPKKERMDSILGITTLREIRHQLDRARQELGKYEGMDVATLLAQKKEQRKLREEMISNFTSYLEKLRKEVSQLQELVEKAKSPALRQLLSLVRDRDRLSRELEGLEQRVRAELSVVGCSSPEEAEALLAKTQQELAEVLKQIEEASKQESLVEEEYTRIKGELHRVQKQLTTHQDLLKRSEKEALCPTCGQKISPLILLSLISSEENELSKLREKEESCRRVREEVRKKLDDLRRKKVSLEQTSSSIKRACTSVKRILEEKKSAESRKRDVVLKIGEGLAELGLDYSPEDVEIQAKLAQNFPLDPAHLDRKKKELEEKRKELVEKEAEVEKHQKQLREIDEAIKALENRKAMADLAKELVERLDAVVEEVRRRRLERIAQRALAIYERMTDQRIYNAFRIDPETYQVYVSTPSLGEAIQATRVGGGHRTLISLALRLAMLQVLNYRHLLIMDEPTYGVDEENLPQLLSHIARLSKEVGQVILVTHHSLGVEDADNIIEVSIEEGASRIIQ